MRNIYKEAIEDVGIDDPKNHGNLEGWAKQGVLLLNTVLTVRRGEANSHAKFGWEEFTDEIINVVNEQKESIVFLLWGGPAQKKAKSVDETKHTVIRTSHPSPLGASEYLPYLCTIVCVMFISYSNSLSPFKNILPAKTASPFLSSKCFSNANEALVSAGEDQIDWNVK